MPGEPLPRRSRLVRMGDHAHSSSCRLRIQSLGIARARGLVGLHIVQAIDNATADLQVLRSLMEPAPTFQGTGTDAPPTRKVDLVKVTNRAVGFAGARNSL